MTIWKVFHGLTNNEIPENFRIRITGPGFDETLTVEEAIHGKIFRKLTPGSYTISESNSGAPGFNMTVNVNNQHVPLPHTFTITATTAHIKFVIDNDYTPIPPPPSEPPPPPAAPPPPSPQTGAYRNLTAPIIILLLGTIFLTTAELYRKKIKKKAK